MKDQERIPTELPYSGLLAVAEREGRVLHREDIYTSGPFVDAVSEEILAFVLEHAGVSVLDVGCGAGPYLQRLRLEGRRCLGVDVDPQAIRMACALGRPVMQMSAYRLSLGEDTFDTVTMIETLEHLSDYDLALQEAARVARTIVVTVPDISVLPKMSTRLVAPWHILEGTHLNFFTPEILRKTLLNVADSCEVSRLGAFFEIDGEPIFMHLAAVARLA